MQTSTLIPAPPARPDDAHKGTFGTVIVVGGSPSMIGAPALAASAALRGGAGLVKIASTPSVLPYAIVIEPSATGIALPENVAKGAQAIDAADPDRRAVLAVGPGLGLHRGAADLVIDLLASDRPVVLDADGLNAWAQSAPTLGPVAAPLIMTPHPGEFRRLANRLDMAGDPADRQQRPDLAGRLASACGACVVLKGHQSVVTDGDRCYINQSGNPSLATAGTGDVLTGLIGSLIAQGMTCFEAAVLGTYLHGLSADLWQSRHGHSGLTARDLADGLPAAFAQRRQQ